MRNFFTFILTFSAIISLTSQACSVTFHGGAGYVGGSCATVKSGDFKLLVDCGTSYGAEYANDESVTNSGTMCGFAFNPKEYNDLIITHAHQDHAGRVPELYNSGFTGTVWTTQASRELLAVAWKSQIVYDTCTIRNWRWTREGKKAAVRVHWHKDCEWSGKISKANLNTFNGIFADLQSHLRTTRLAARYAQACRFCQDLEMRDIMRRVKTVEFDMPFNIGPLTVTFSSVKHLPGAASVRLEDVESSALFSGDLGTLRSHLVKSIAPARRADMVFIESTYGDASHGSNESVEAEYKKFVDVIGETVRGGGVAWIPSFALDRSQRVFLEIKRAMLKDVIPEETPIYYLSPTAREYMELYVSNPQWFDFPDEVASMSGLFKASRKSFSPKAKLKNGAILITTSGNMSTGNSLKYIPDLLPRETTSLCLVGYQTPGTYGHRLQQIARGKSDKKSITLREGRTKTDVAVNAKIYDFNCFSGHGDARENDAWLANNLDSQIFLVHGNISGLKERANGLRTRLGCKHVVVAEPEVTYTVKPAK